MRWISLTLLFGVIVRHDSSRWLADWLGMSSRMVFYILGGFWEALLCLFLGLVCLNQKSDYRHIAVMACLIGVSEGLQIGICGILQTPIPGKNLCDAYTNLPIGALLTSLYAVSISYLWRPTKMLNLITVVASAEVAYLTNFYVGILLLSVCFAIGRVRHGRQP